MDMRAVLDASPRMMGILSEALASGKIIEGHARGLSGGGLQAYLAGISRTTKLSPARRARETARRHDRGNPRFARLSAADVVKAVCTLLVVPHSLTVCTDDVFRIPGRPGRRERRHPPHDRYGMAPLQAIRCATINNAMRCVVRPGWVCAGRRADLALLSDLKEIAVEHVYVSGRRIASTAR